MDRLSALGASQPGMTQLAPWEIAVDNAYALARCRNRLDTAKGVMEFAERQRKPQI